MQIRTPFRFTILTAALVALTLPSLAQNAPTPDQPASAPPTPDVAVALPAPNPDAPPRDGERRDDERRGEGRRNREGGPREGGPFGGGERPRGEGGMRPDETPEQFQQRMLAPYVAQIPDLSDAQKTHILAILDAANAESRAARQDTTLSQERQRAVGRAIRADIPNRVKSALTEAQLGPYEALIAEQAENDAAMAKVGAARPEEDVEQMRARVSKGYEDVFEELSVKQKTQIIQILESAGEKSADVDANSNLTAVQKSAALLQIHNSSDAQVLPLLDAEQKKSWKKAHEVKRPK